MTQNSNIFYRLEKKEFKFFHTDRNVPTLLYLWEFSFHEKYPWKRSRKTTSNSITGGKEHVLQQKRFLSWNIISLPDKFVLSNKNTDSEILLHFAVNILFKCLLNLSEYYLF